jgi:hypothetical protein
MFEQILVLLLVEQALGAREWRLLIREQRWKLRVETASHLALALAVLVFAGLPVPR